MAILKKTIFSILILVGIVIFKDIGKHLVKWSFNDEKKPSKISKKWIKAKVDGIEIETLGELKTIRSVKPEAQLTNVRSLNSYLSNQNGVITEVVYMDSNFDIYDIKAGLKAEAESMIKQMKGTDMSLSFAEMGSFKDRTRCEGSFKIEKIPVVFTGFCYWNSKGKAAVVLAFSDKNQESSNDLNRIVNSVKVDF